MPYLSALEVWSRQGAIQIHVYLYLTLPNIAKCFSGATFLTHTVHHMIKLLPWRFYLGVSIMSNKGPIGFLPLFTGHWTSIEFFNTGKSSNNQHPSQRFFNILHSQNPSYQTNRPVEINLCRQYFWHTHIIRYSVLYRITCRYKPCWVSVWVCQKLSASLNKQPQIAHSR